MKNLRSIRGWNHFVDCEFLSFAIWPLLHGWWPICHRIGSDQKYKKNMLSLMFLSSNEYFLSPKREKFIRIYFGALKSLVHIEKALQRWYCWTWGGDQFTTDKNFCFKLVIETLSDKAICSSAYQPKALELALADSMISSLRQTSTSRVRWNRSPTASLEGKRSNEEWMKKNKTEILCKVMHINWKVLSLQSKQFYCFACQYIEGLLEKVVNCIPWRQRLELDK